MFERRQRIFSKAAEEKIAREEEANVTRNARETRDNDEELMLANTHSRTQLGSHTRALSKTTLMWCRKNILPALLFWLMFVVMWCVMDHRIEVIKVQVKNVKLITPRRRLRNCAVERLNDDWGVVGSSVFIEATICEASQTFFVR